MKALVAEKVGRQLKDVRREPEAEISQVRARTVDDRATLVVFSGDLDKAIAAMVIATGAAAAALETVERYESFLKELGVRLVRILDTHVHSDHVSGGPELAERTGAPYFVAAGSDFELRKKVTPFADGAEILLGGKDGVRMVVQAVATPGLHPAPLLTSSPAVISSPETRSS
jgi:glyoxylase-like metal-dependent hydrolase (beta-lactamase superfamily II)